MKRMQICIVGWYLEPLLFDMLGRLDDSWDVHLLTFWKRAIAIRDKMKEVLKLARNVRSWSIPVSGLEWGHYDHFLKNVWDRESNVLLMHDDIRIHDMKFFEKVRALKCDQAFIFRTKEEAKQNQHFHGRGIFMAARCIEYILSHVCTCKQSHEYVDVHNNYYCSQKCYDEYLAQFGSRYPIKTVWMDLKEPRQMRCANCRVITKGSGVYTYLRGTGPHSGIWYDFYNDGQHASGKPPLGIRHYNDGVYHFALQMKRLHSMKRGDYCFNTDEKVYFPEFEHAKRGKYVHG